MGIIDSNEAGTRLCEAMGIPADRVVRLIFDIDVNQPIPKVYVQMVNDEETIKVLFDVLKEATEE